MSTTRLQVLADDLTGAAEIAAVGHRFGLRAFVAHDANVPADCDLLVFNTDSRLVTPAEAAARVTSALRRINGECVFKKIDSVLRGPVLVELEACALALGKDRVLLVPANPSLGRTIHDGDYFIQGVPLAKTAFARDPSHPACSSSVLALLGPALRWPVVVTKPTVPPPPRHVTVGEASVSTHIAAWANRIETHTLAAGGAEFFAAVMKTRGLTESPAGLAPAVVRGPSLLVSGTTSPVSRPLHDRLNSVVLTSTTHTEAAFGHILADLRERQVAALSTDPFPSAHPSAPTSLLQTIAAISNRLHLHQAFRHLLIEGGATSASVLRALRWETLEVVHVWEPGVVTLRPIAAPGCLVTLKPGSYSWPAALAARLTSAHPST